MNDSSNDRTSVESDRDWVLPLFGVLVALLVFVVIGLLVAAARSDTAEDSFAGQVEVYTNCLRDNGANVPQVEALGDGGFRITVEGPVLQQRGDLESLREAHDVCEALTPDLELLLAQLGPELLLGLSEFDGFEERFTPPDDEFFHGRSPHHRFPGDRFHGDRFRGFGPGGFDLDLEEACELLESGELPDSGPRIERLREVCAGLED